MRASSPSVSILAFVEEGLIIHDTACVEPAAVILRGKSPDVTQVEANVFVGANATVLGGVRLGLGCRIEPGAVVHHDVPPHAIVAGNPAVLVGYVNSSSVLNNEAFVAPRPGEAVFELLKNGASLWSLPRVRDVRGSLSVSDFGGDGVPFTPLRCFFVYDVPSSEVRGQHAHYACHQFLVAVCGSVMTMVDDGKERKEVLLDHPSKGLYMPPLTWGVQYQYSGDAVLMVLASHPYDPSDYIRDYQTFLAVPK